MARQTKKNKAQVNKQLWERANNSHRQRWQSLSQKGYDFYLDEQLTKEEKDQLEESGMPTFTINRVTPIIEIMKYFVTANNPKWKAVGATGDDVDAAQVHSDIADYCWYLSNGKSLYSQIALDALTKGIGYFFVDVDKDADRGMGEVRFNRLDPYDVYVDPASRDFLFRDASFIQVRKVIARQRLINMLPQFESKIKKCTKSTDVVSYSQRDSYEGGSTQPEDITMGLNIDAEDDDLIPYYETYSKKKFPYYNVWIKIMPTPAEMEVIQEEVKKKLEDFEKEIEVGLIEKEIKIQQSLENGEIIPERAKLEIDRGREQAQQAIEEQKQVMTAELQDAATKVTQQVMTEKDFNILSNSKAKKNIVDKVKFYENRIIQTCSVGDDVFLYEYTLPMQEYPIIPIPYMYTGTPYPMSAVTPLIGKQQEINKAHQIMLHNANLASNLRWMYEEGSVPEEEWEKYSSSPGALLKYRQGFAPPQPVQPLPLNAAFYGITENAKRDMEYTSGIYSSMQGDTGSSPETYRGLLAMDEYGTRRIKSWMQNIIEPSLEHLGRIFKDFAQDTYQAHKIFRIVQPNNIDEEKQVEINVPIFNDYGKSIQKWNDYSSSKFDVRIIGGSTLPLNRWALLEEYFKWFQSGLIDDIAMISETDIRNKESIIKRKSVYMQLRNQLEEMQNIVTDREGTIETLERQLVQTGIKSKVQDADMQIQKDLLETEAAQSMLRNKLKSDTTTKIKELGLAVADAKKKATTK